MPRAGRGDMFSRNSREDILRDVLGLAPAEDATEELQQTEQLEAVEKEVANRARQAVGMSEDEANALIISMKAAAVRALEVEITEENWRESLTTPLGEVKMGANQKTKMFVKGREQQYGMLIETLSNPDIVLEEMDKEDNLFHERPSSYIFIKTFLKPDGTKYIHFESVTVSQDGMEVSISSHIIRENQLREKLKSDRLLYMATALDEPANSSAEQPISEGGGLSSADKGTETSGNEQGNGEKNVRTEKRDRYNAGERVVLDEDGKVYTIEYITTEGEFVPGGQNSYVTYYHLKEKPFGKYTAGQLSGIKQQPLGEPSGTEAGAATCRGKGNRRALRGRRAA